MAKEKKEKKRVLEITFGLTVLRKAKNEFENVAPCVVQGCMYVS